MKYSFINAIRGICGQLFCFFNSLSLLRALANERIFILEYVQVRFYTLTLGDIEAKELGYGLSQPLFGVQN